MSDIATVNDHLVELESELERLRKATDEIATAKKAASEVMSASQSMLSTLKQVTADFQHLSESSKSVTRKIDETLDSILRVDFPSRLDKLDNTVSAVNIGVQNLATSFHDLSQEFGVIENHLTSLRHALMLQQGIMFAIAVLLVGGFVALFLR
jgi:chromosome segregation ATPase